MMKSALTMAARGGCLLLATAAWAILSGCAGAQFGSELAARPRPHALRGGQSVTLHLPQDERFAIALPSASRKAGLDGEVQADATARPTGDAEASATVRESGTAEGLFQVGHALANETDEQMDLDLTVRCRFEFEVGNEPAERLPDATVGLRLYARDSRGRLLRDLVLVDYSTESGPARRHGDNDLSFTVTLGPGNTVNVFLAGLARVDVRSQRSASARLKLSNLEFDVTTRPTPAVRTAADDSR